MYLFLRILTWFFGAVAMVATGGITVLLVIDGGAKQLGEQFERTPGWIYAVLVIGAAACALLAWLANWFAEYEEPAVLPPNSPEPKVECWVPGILLSTDKEAVLRD